LLSPNTPGLLNADQIKAIATKLNMSYIDSKNQEVAYDNNKLQVTGLIHTPKSHRSSVSEKVNESDDEPVSNPTNTAHTGRSHKNSSRSNSRRNLNRNNLNALKSLSKKMGNINNA
jgi:hypothetical protein